MKAGFGEDGCSDAVNASIENVFAIAKLCRDKKLSCDTDNLMRIDGLLGHALQYRISFSVSKTWFEKEEEEEGEKKETEAEDKTKIHTHDEALQSMNDQIQFAINFK